MTNVKITIDEEFQSLLIPLTDKQRSQLEESLKRDGCLDPLVVWDEKNTEGKEVTLISGHNRKAICDKHGIAYVTKSIWFPNRKAAKRWIREHQLARRNLSIFARCITVLGMKDDYAEEAQERMEAGSCHSSVDPTLNSKEGLRYSGETLDILAKLAEVKRDTLIKVEYILENTDDLKNNQFFRLIVGDEKLSIHNVYKSLMKFHGKTTEFKPQIYDVWNFQSLDEDMGIDYPGRIPGQLVLNVLYYFTKQGDLVIDPMAGGGTTMDACLRMNIDCLCFDINPAKDFIIKHDIQHGFPELKKKPNLIFLDPPYYKKKEKEYGENSVSSQDRNGYMKFFSKLANDCFNILEVDGRVAFLMSNYLDYDNYTKSIFINDYVKRFVDVGFTVEMRFQCPLSTEQYKGFQVKQAKAKKKILMRSRDLIIFKKETGR